MEYAQTALAKVRLDDYAFDADERLIAQMLKAYLGDMEESAAKELLGSIVKPGMERTTIEGKLLAALIDKATAHYLNALMKENRKDGAAARKRLAGLLEKINGTVAVQNSSVDFYEFLEDCQKALPGMKQ